MIHSNSSRKIHKLFIGLATISAIFLTATPDAQAKTVDAGEKTQVISDGDKQTRKEVSAVSAPTTGQPSITVNETLYYLHSPWQPWKSNQTYFIRRSATAEYVDRLGYWMLLDAAGTFYKFTPGSTAGTVVSKPSVDIGAQSSPLSPSDTFAVAAGTAGDISLDGRNRTINFNLRYQHNEKYNTVTYTVPTPIQAEFVDLQGAYMVWVQGSLYRATRDGTVQTLSHKPGANAGLRSSLISGSDTHTSGPLVSAGSVSSNGRTRTLVVSNSYKHEEKYQVISYSVETAVTAVWVQEQGAFMAIIDGRYYKTAIGTNNVTYLHGKPGVNLGSRFGKINFNDRLTGVQVFARELTVDRKAVVVYVRRSYRIEETFQTKEYYVEAREVAYYNSTLKVWTVIVDGKVYAIAFGADQVNDSSVIVVPAPSDLTRPDVIVVPGSPSNNGNPPIVVPAKPKTTPQAPPRNNDEPAIVVPGKPKAQPTPRKTDEPEIVVPGKPKQKPAPAPRIDADDEAPAIVVPRR